MAYQPPFTITSEILNLVAGISGLLGRLEISNPQMQSPQLRRGNRIRTIQASLAIENNTLSLEQVTAVLEGKRVFGTPSEIQEVHNAFCAYDKLADWRPDSVTDLLSAHSILMYGLEVSAGNFRRGGVGIYRGEQLVHMAPPAERVPLLISDLVHWTSISDCHPLVVSCVFHYEFEFIHPFSDGNGRMGRLWQSLLLSQWQPVFAYLPVETVIKDQQNDYYQALAEADKLSEATPFVVFMLRALLIALHDISNVESKISVDQLRPEISKLDSQLDKKVLRLLNYLKGRGELSQLEIMSGLELKHRPTFRQNYLAPALELGVVKMLYPESPRSPKQKYFFAVDHLAKNDNPQ